MPGLSRHFPLTFCETCTAVYSNVETGSSEAVGSRMNGMATLPVVFM